MKKQPQEEQKQATPSTERKMTMFPNGRKTRAFTYEEIITVAVGIHKPGDAPHDTVEEALRLMREALVMSDPDTQRRLMLRNAWEAPLKPEELDLSKDDFLSPLCRWEGAEPVSAWAFMKEVMNEKRIERIIDRLIKLKEKELNRKALPKERTEWTKQFEAFAKQQVQRKAGESSDPVSWILEKAIGSSPDNK